MKVWLYAIIVGTSVVALGACESKKRSPEVGPEPAAWSVEETTVVTEPARPERPRATTRWLTYEDGKDGDYSLPWRRDKKTTAMELYLGENENFASHRRSQQGLYEWTTSDRQDCADTPYGSSPFLISERVWVGISKPFLDHDTVFVECSHFARRVYNVAPNLAVTCTDRVIFFHFVFEEGMDATSEEFGIDDSIRDFFYLPYIYEERDWSYSSDEEAIFVERPDDVVARPYPDVAFYPEDYGEPREWSVIVANDLGRIDRVSFEHIPMRLQRRSMFSPDEPSVWYRRHDEHSAHNQLVTFTISHVEPLEIDLDIPIVPTMHERGVQDYDKICIAKDLPRSMGSSR